jgi:hypothetical protein
MGKGEIMKACAFSLIGCIFTSVVFAGPKFTYNNGKSDCEITQSYQLWATSTRNPNDVPVTDSRADLFLKQGRVGLKGHAFPSFSYSTLLAFDNLGKDQFTGALGSAQATNNSTFQLYDFNMTYALDTTFVNITFGYFRPQTGHENIAPDAGVSSLDKGLTSLYLRSFLTGRTSGRETGVNIGGFFSRPLIGIDYNLGVFDPTIASISGTDGGPRKWHPLMAGRLALSLFDADMSSYRLVPEVNFFGTRKGVTFGGHASYQGATDETWDTSAVKFDNTKKVYSGLKYVGGFQKNRSFGGDFTANFMGLNIDGEYDIMKRSVNGFSSHKDSVKASAADFTDRVYHIRAGYDIALPKEQFIEPTLMYTEFVGDAVSVLYPGGEDHILDVGVNWYINKNNFKIALHYIKQGGKPKSNYQSAAATATSQTVRGDMAAVNFQVQF